jgi:hypothetical protein
MLSHQRLRRLVKLIKGGEKPSSDQPLPALAWGGVSASFQPERASSPPRAATYPLQDATATDREHTNTMSQVETIDTLHPAA